MDGHTKVFSLDEANDILPEVIRITERAIAEIEAQEFPWRRLNLDKFDPLTRMTFADLVRRRWVEEIAELGAQPKGFFTVDFQSEQPDLLYCWTYGETAITHCHKAYETFVDRRRLDEVIGPSEP